MAVPEALVDSVARFLGGHAPFARLAAADLRYLSEHLRLAYFPAHAVIAETGAGDAALLHIVQRGHVRYEPRSGGGFVLGPGECFPLEPPADELGPGGRFVATEDVFCYQLEGQHLRALQARSPPFRDYCTASLESLSRASEVQLHRGFMDRALEQRTLLEPLAALLRRAPVACVPATSVQEALARMSAAGVGTIAVVDEAGKPLGIFTLTDLMERIALTGRPLTTPVGAVMTAAPASLDDQASAQDAMAVMAARSVHQLLVTREGVLSGVISERDLFALQRVSIRNVQQRIRTATDESLLHDAVRELGRLTDNLLAQGMGSEPLTRIISAINDTLSCRVLELAAQRFDLAALRWCWLSLGSEGRREQTVVSDQDNALIFAAHGGPAAAAALRARLLPFAGAVNDMLARLGFPLCPGRIMAGNPDWCLSEEEWRMRFDGWIREPTPEALLHANIFFDFRPLHGDHDLSLQLRAWLAGHAAGGRLFLTLMTANALQCPPPLGLLRTFRTDEGAAAGTLDLKTQGTRLFVDAARVLALTFGISETHTIRRLQQGGRALLLPERDLAGIAQAFEFLQLLRLRAQRGVLYPPGAEAGVTPDINRIDPYALSDPDQRLLKESFRQARALQVLLERTAAHGA